MHDERYFQQMQKLQQMLQYYRVIRFITHFVVGSAVTLLPTTSSEISYTLAEFSNEFKNENQEGHDFRNVFNAQMQAVAKRNRINITGKE